MKTHPNKLYQVLFIVGLPKNIYTKTDIDDLINTGFMEMSQIHEVFNNAIYFENISEFLYALNNNIIKPDKFYFTNCYKLIN